MATNIFANETPTRSLSEFEFVHDPSDKASKLGVGSFASVKLVKEKKTGKLYALKIITMNPAKMTNSDLHNIRMEVSIHRRLNHPNIVKFHDYIQKEQNIHFILDYVENGNLYSYIHKKRGLSEKEAFRFFHQTCLAIQYLHENDIMHRDLKPENLLLDRKLNIKLCDFGWSTKRITEKRQTFCGTYEYMAPEIVYKRSYDYRVDIWSLGILLFELFHLEAPYKGRSHTEISKSLLKSQITFNSTIHPEAKDLIQQILKHDPNERFSITQILSHPWVKGHLLPEPSFNEQLLIEKISPRTTKSSHSISLESSRRRRDKENIKSEIFTITESGLLTQIISPRSQRRSPVSILGPFTGGSMLKEKEGAISNREKESGQTTERERFREQILNSVVDTTATLSLSDIQKKKQCQDSSSSILLKTVDGNTSVSKGHSKSSVSLSGNILNRLIQQESGRSLQNRSRNNNKGPENNLLTPNSIQLKTKINDMILQLSSQTTRNRVSTEYITIKDLSQHSSRNGQNGSKSSSRLNRGQQQAFKESLELNAASRGKSEIKEDNCQFSTSGSSTNTSKMARSESEIKRRNALNQVPANFHIKLSLTKGEDIQNVSTSVPKTARVTRPRLETRSPEATDYQINLLSSLSKLSTTRNMKSPSNIKTDRILSSRGQKSRTRTEENQEYSGSYSNFCKAIDSKKQGSTFISELSSINQRVMAFKDKSEIKLSNRDALRERENQAIVQKGYGRIRVI